MPLSGKIVSVQDLNENNRRSMYLLMNTYYDDVSSAIFYRDLDEKDHCILLVDDQDEIKGFSTQKIIHLRVGNKQVAGVFSGDTIIDREHWGSLELFRVFARHYVHYGKQYEVFYWFLISKGYKTYKVLPVFFNAFYPNCQVETPVAEQAVIHALGHSRYPGEYDETRGVIVYRGIKDKLKQGVADITERHLKDPHIKFFAESNPGYYKGDDLVCLARLDEGNLNSTAHRRLMGTL